MKLTELIKKKNFVVTSEIGPPKGWQVEHHLDEAKKYFAGIVDAVNVTDNQSSVMRFGSLATCHYHHRHRH